MPQLQYDAWDVLDAQNALEQLRADVIQTLTACLGAAIISVLMIPHVPLALAVVYAGLVFLACAVAFVQVALCCAEERRVRAFVAAVQGGT